MYAHVKQSRANNNQLIKTDCSNVLLTQDIQHGSGLDAPVDQQDVAIVEVRAAVRDDCLNALTPSSKRPLVDMQEGTLPRHPTQESDLPAEPK